MANNKLQGGRVRGTVGVSDAALTQTSVIECAGTIVWRLAENELQVLIIHRPKYDDWSWPKGKVDAGEALPVAAIRETAEETGEQVVLGIPLPGLQYITPDGLVKRVHYWAATVATDSAMVKARSKFAEPDGKEVDKARWVSIKKAKAKLSRPADKIPLRALEEVYKSGKLVTHAFIIARHGKALARSLWQAEEADRPLTPLGVAQAQALVPVLASFGITKVVTSLWQRCSATVAPYAQAGKIRWHRSKFLTEAEHEINPARVSKVVKTLLTDSKQVVLCTHRPVLPTIFSCLRENASTEVTRVLKREDPYLSPGQALILHVNVAETEYTASGKKKPAKATIVGVEIIKPELY